MLSLRVFLSLLLDGFGGLSANNLLDSGVIDTPLVKALGPADVVNDRLITRTALKRIAQPEEVSKVVLFLLSEASGYVTSSVRQPSHLYTI